MAVTRHIDMEFTCGDDVELSFSVPGIPTGQTIVKAWFTAKRILPEADPGLVQKIVTTANVAGTGQITDDGAGDTVGQVRIDLQPAESALLVNLYPYDVQVKTNTGKIYTAIDGCIRGKRGVTDAIT